MDIQSLSTPERILLAEQLWDSVRDKSDEIEITPEQVKLLESRISALEVDGDIGDTWENVKARITNSES
jgi:putative addiction module component (TIGR02574 family)